MLAIEAVNVRHMPYRWLGSRARGKAYKACGTHPLVVRRRRDAVGGLELTAVGVIVADIIAADLPKVASPGELVVLPRTVELHVGGHPANITIDLVNLGQRGESLKAVGAVGEDVFGNFVLNTLSSKGIRTAISRYKVGTTKNVVLVVKGEDRRFHVEPGASWELKADEVIAALEEEPPRIFYVVSGMCREVDNRIAEIMGRASDLGCITFLDVITALGIDWSFVRNALKYSDIFHCNAFEMLNLTNSVDFEASIERMLELGVKLMFLTDGEKGAYAIDREKTVSQPAFRVESIDPTGAGDAFCAGIMDTFFRRGVGKNDVSRLPAEQVVEILEMAQAAGAACVTAIGTTTGVTAERVARIIASQGEEIKRGTRVSFRTKRVRD
ncbi:MAG: carbohydrate kinase family protein [Candidatus Brockarchaeota archaeon]|nr:carbohydrate kinase family protein [Candidatus Brockarchaeota archaeon]